MKLRLWPRKHEDEPAGEEPEPEAEAEAEAEAAEPRRPGAPPVTPAPAAVPARPRPARPASEFARPYAPEERDENKTEAPPVPPAEPPATVSLTVEEAKTAIRAAGGDVIQIGFLANAYRRRREEEPAGKETAAAGRRLAELVAKRLKDRKLLAAEGRLELLEEPPPRPHAAWPDDQ